MSTTQASQAAQSPQAFSPGLTQPVANEINKKLVPGENPLDFIKKNIAARAGMQIVPQVVIQAEEAKRNPPPAPVQEAAPVDPATIQEKPVEPPKEEVKVSKDKKKLRKKTLTIQI